LGEHLLCTQGVASSNLVASTTPGKGSHRVVLALILLLAGCAAKRVQTGLVLEEGDNVYLVTQPGERTRLVLDDQSAPIEQLLGCRLRVDGQPKFGALVVEDFEVLDAGYGAPPHVGRLMIRGGRLMMNDQNSGALIELVGDGSAPLWGHSGALILVNGAVVGPHQVRVMNHRVLIPKQGGNTE
jgi:hypothetical protein